MTRKAVASVAMGAQALRSPGSAARPSGGDDRGFTLLELLVALVVLGLLLVTLTQGLRLGVRARQIDAGMQAGAADLEATARVLRQLIARAAPGDPSTQDAAFIGTAHAASFLTTLPAGFGSAATSEADVSLGVGAGHQLELRWRPHYRRWIATPPPPQAAALLDGVERLDLSFWQKRPGSSGGSWVSAWAEPDLPGLVRVHLVFPSGDRRRWPDIIVGPMREAPRP
jgi:general secretion pathway protein J